MSHSANGDGAALSWQACQSHPRPPVGRDKLSAGIGGLRTGMCEIIALACGTFWGPRIYPTKCPRARSALRYFAGTPGGLRISECELKRRVPGQPRPKLAAK